MADAASPPDLQRDGVLRPLHDDRSFGLGFRLHDGRSMLENRHIRDGHRHVIRVETYTRPARRCQNAPPVGIASENRGLHELGTRDRPGDLHGVGIGSRSSDLDADQVLRTFAIGDDLLGKRLEHLGQRTGQPPAGRRASGYFPGGGLI